MKAEHLNQVNDSSKFDDFVDDFKANFLEIKKQFDDQQDVIEKLSQQNKQILKFIESLDQNLDKLFLAEVSNNKNPESDSDSDAEAEEEEEEFNKDMGTFNMVSQTITFEGKEYKINNELLFCGREQLNNALKLFNEKRNQFPQGLKYCKYLLIKQQKEDGSLLILSQSTYNRTITFFFIFKDINELSPTRGWFYDNEYELKEQIQLLTKDYANDIYPQGSAYCLSVLNEQLKQNGAVRILVRYNGEKWTRYYFKTRHIKVIPNEKFAWITGKDKLEHYLKFIDIQSKSENTIFYNGEDYCKEIVKKEIENNGQIFIIKADDPLTKKTTFYYYPQSDIEFACNAEWWHVPISKVVSREMKLIDQRNKQANHVYPQTANYCKNLIQEQMRNHETFHIIVRNTSKDIWLYFKD